MITEEAVRVLEEQHDSGEPIYLHVTYNAPHFGKGWDAENQQTENVMQPKPADLEQVSHIRDPLRRAFAAKVVGDTEGMLFDLSKDPEETTDLSATRPEIARRMNELAAE